MEPEARRPSDTVLLLAAFGALIATAVAWLLVLLLLLDAF
jgi:hypothetical protein